MAIIGRFIAEGYSDSSSYQIGFAANCLEKHIQDRIESYFAKFGVTSYRPEKGNDCKLVFTSKIFKALFTSLCGIGAENKHLPIIDGSYFTYSRRQMLKILEGYVGGDGHISIKPNTSSVLCATTSRLLAYQISDVLHALDFISLPTVRNHSKAKHKNPKANPKNWLPLYVLHMSEIDIKPFCNLINIKRDIPFKNQLIGMVIGQFSKNELDEYLTFQKEMNKRIINMMTERIVSHYVIPINKF